MLPFDESRICFDCFHTTFLSATEKFLRKLSLISASNVPTLQNDELFCISDISLAQCMKFTCACFFDSYRLHHVNIVCHTKDKCAWNNSNKKAKTVRFDTSDCLRISFKMHFFSCAEKENLVLNSMDSSRSILFFKLQKLCRSLYEQ